MFSETKHFYLENDTLVFNDSASIELLEEIAKNKFFLNGIVKFDLRLLGNSIKAFLRKLLNLVLNMDVKGVTMYVSEEVNYITKDYDNQNIDLYNSNPIVIFETSKKVDIVFFNGIEEISINELKKKLDTYKDKNVVFNFGNLDSKSLNAFIPCFMGWIIGFGFKNIAFAQHYGEVDTLLEKKGVYCMIQVSNLISFPKKKTQKIKSTKNKKINEFLRFVNHGALQF